MARLLHEDGTTLTDTAAIGAVLAPLGVALQRWPVADDPEAAALLAAPALDDAQKEALAVAHDHYFRELQATAGYQTRDVIVLHPELPGLDGLLTKFDRVHTHDDDEVRYIVAGEGVFGFVLPDGEQVAITVEAGDYINVPKDTLHWFELTPERTIKALRYFTSMEGWVPVYRDVAIRVGR